MIIGGGGGGFDFDPCPDTFTVDFESEITQVRMSRDGYICEKCSAPSPDGLHLLELERGTRTLDADGNIVRRLEVREVESPALPSYTVLVGSAYDFGPSPVSFNKLVSLTLGYVITDFPSNALALGMNYYDVLGNWTPVYTVDRQVAEIGSLTGELNHFTIFAILAEVPGFEVRHLSIDASRTPIWPFLTFAVRTGQEATVSVNVVNTGNHEAIRTVRLEVNGATEGTQAVTLDAGQSAELVFELEGNAPGKYVVVVEGLTGEFSNSLWINWWLILLVAGGVILVILIGFWGYRKTREIV